MFLCGSLWNKKEWGIGGGVVISTQCEFVSFDFHKKLPRHNRCVKGEFLRICNDEIGL